MGIKGFYDWLKSKAINYTPCNVPNFKENDTFIADAKCWMYKMANGIPADSADFVQDLAKAMIRQFQPFKGRILFVNDGKHLPHTLKDETCKKRAEIHEKQCQNLKRARDEKDVMQSRLEQQEKKGVLSDLPDFVFDNDDAPPSLKALDILWTNSVEAEEKQVYEQLNSRVDSLERSTRRITFEITRTVLQALGDAGFMAFQCQGEADPVLAHLAPYVTYVLTEDSDLLALYGIDNLCRFTKNGWMVYNANDILTAANISQEQLMEIALMSGSDVTMGGIHGIGLKRGRELIQEHTSLANVIRWLKNSQTRFVVTAEFERRVEEFSDVLRDKTDLPKPEDVLTFLDLSNPPIPRASCCRRLFSLV